MILAVSENPDLAPLVAEWLVAEFGHPGGRTVEQLTAHILSVSTEPKDAFVLFDEGRPVGTASLARSDLASRPDLTPWLAGVYVEPAYRGRGHATRLVRRVEAFAAAASIPSLWLYTWTAEPLYARLGWTRVGLEQDHGLDVTLMTRSLSGDPRSPAA